MIEQIEAEIFQDFQTKGRSRPARLTCRRANGETLEVFIKFAGGVPDHYFGLSAELLCSLIARHLGFSTPEPYIVNLSREFLAGAPPEAKDLITRSLGLNFATVAAGDGYSVVPTEPHLTRELRRVAAEIYAFDVMMQNFDRKADNPNMLWDRSRIVLIDHESALNSVLHWPDLNAAHLALDKFYDHVFYTGISPADADFQRLVTALQTLTPAVIAGFFDLLPPVWREEKTLPRIQDYLNFLVANRQAVCDLIGERIS